MNDLDKLDLVALCLTLIACPDANLCRQSRWVAVILEEAGPCRVLARLADDEKLLDELIEESPNRRLNQCTRRRCGRPSWQRLAERKKRFSRKPMS